MFPHVMLKTQRTGPVYKILNYLTKQQKNHLQYGYQLNVVGIQPDDSITPHRNSTEPDEATTFQNQLSLC